MTIAVIPYKSRAFHIIQDLSFNIIVDEEKIQSVNDATVRIALEKALQYIGEALSQLIAAIAKARKDIPILFSKADIKDSFW